MLLGDNCIEGHTKYNIYRKILNKLVHLPKLFLLRHETANIQRYIEFITKHTILKDFNHKHTKNSRTMNVEPMLSNVFVSKVYVIKNISVLSTDETEKNCLL